MHKNIVKMLEIQDNEYISWQILLPFKLRNIQKHNNIQKLHTKILFFSKNLKKNNSNGNN